MLGRVLVTRALADLHVGGPDAARRTLGEARRAARAADSRYVVALAFVQEGTIAMYRGDWEAGLAALDQVHEDDLRAPAEVLAVLLNRGLASITLRRPAAGRRDLRAALRLALQQDWPEVVFKARHNLGCLEFFVGHLPEAIRIMQEADELPVRVDRLQSRRDIATALLEVGLVDPAQELLRLALRSARGRHLRLDEGNILLDLVGAQLLAGNVTGAARSAAAAVRAFRSYGDERLAAHADLMATAVDLARGRTRAAPRPELVDTRTAAGRTATRLTAELLIGSGDLVEAAGLLDELAGAPADGIDTVMHEHLLRARIAADAGDTAGTEREFRSAARKLARMQGSVASLETRAAVAVHGARLADFNVSRAMRRGDPAEVFRAVERWRAASQRLPAVHPHPDPRVASLASRLRQLRHDVQAGDDRADRRADIAALEAQLGRRLWSAGASDSAVGLAPVSYRGLRAQLDAAGTTLLYYFWDADTIHLLSCGPGGSAVRRLGDTRVAKGLAERLEADLRVRAHTEPGGALGAAIDRGVARTLERLDTLLLPGDLEPRTDSVLIVPTPELGSLPWSMLPSLSERSVVMVPSVSRWCSIRDQETRAGSAAFFLGPRIAHGPAEIEQVERVWRATGLAVTGHPGATTVDLLEAFRSNDLVHVAAHGVHAQQSPLFSRLELQDGPLFAHELTGVGRMPQHVVLSACDLGRSRIGPGDEPLGLAAALLGLGVRSVVAAAGPVNDAQAAEIMGGYHQGLAAGLSAAQSLRAARADHRGAAIFNVYGADWTAVRGAPEESATPAGERNAVSASAYIR
ncbi:CHAT domain-containing protein [Flexivirga oryzae]|uniref:Tetratricopeptide (TPR) repeat protein n=1 Tax=Flexivirga oryzae TaxID=1794944 RepID=A0A839N235_9MICO|nr:CHAT domain-containing tetratricopeptide repeat protein [Flexivirga oryzae]MBB2891768.1 tetratricopeptide (TPR) repeat protein [Flexivirga oryzae]